VFMAKDPDATSYSPGSARRARTAAIQVMGSCTLC
jgi:hypothetical protein